ncbi:MAG: NADPH-dependent F420 reductase [Halobacteriales archaeon]
MDIAILGGTGDIGQGLALRWAHDTDHSVVVGSRERSRAVSKANEYETELESMGREREIEGYENAEAAGRGELVVLAVPAYHVADTVEAVADELDDAILVTPAVGMQNEDGEMRYNPPGVGSVTELVAEAAPDGVPVVGAFHNLPAGRLADLDADLEIDTLLVGDDGDAKDIVDDLADDVAGLRALDAGALGNAAEVEAVTPLLVNVARHNKRLHDLGIRVQ